MSRRHALARLGAMAAIVGCVDIATGPGGVDSIRLDTRAHAIVLGDTLRDSTGEVAPIRATAFDANGNAIGDAAFELVALPTRAGTDTTTRPPAVAVDATTGIVRSLTPRTVSVARVAVQVGGRLQLIDTLRIVTKPTTLSRSTPTDSAGVASRLVFSCAAALTDRVESLQSNPIAGLFPDTAFVGNALALATKLTGDSSGTAVPVPSYYVQYRIVSPAPESIPSVTVNGVTRPALSIVRDIPSDRTSPYDTTDASGVSTVALRVFGRALGPDVFAGPTLRVQVRAQARRTPTDTLQSVDFVVTLRRVFNLTDPNATSCPSL